MKRYIDFTGVLALEEDDFKALTELWEASDTEEGGQELFDMMVDLCMLNMITAEPRL